MLYRANERQGRLKQLSRAELVRNASKYLQKEALEIFRVQLYLQPLSKFGRRWPDSFKPFALNLFFHSPKAYKYLAKLLSLPSQRSLQTWLSDIVIEPGLIASVLDTVKKNMKDWPLKDRVCTLLFDEMSLKRNLYYDVKRDLVHGYADNGTKRSSEIANSVLVVLLSGVSKQWIQPLSFILVSKKLNPEDLEKMIIDIIQDLGSGGVLVKAVICDQGGSNRTMATKLGVTPDHPFFMVGDERVYFMFDTPHLLKCTRNNLRKGNLQIGSKTVKWSYIREVHSSSHPLKLKLAPKLTDRHVNQTPFGNMKVKLAAQVLSNSVAAAVFTFAALNILAPDSVFTAEFIERMDQLFDSLNSSVVCRDDSRKLRYAITATSEHHEFLKSCLSWIAQWKFISAPKQPPTIKGWQITVSAILLFWEDVHQNCDTEVLLTRRLNQDPIENLFATVRQQHGCNETPNAFQFVTGLKHILVGKLFKLSTRSNCEADRAAILTELKSLPMPIPSTVAPLSDEPTDSDNNGSVSVGALTVQDVVEANIHYYVAGNTIACFLRRTDCAACSPLIRCLEEPLTDRSYLAMFMKQDSTAAQVDVCRPTAPCAAFVDRLEVLFLSKVERVLHLKGVLKVLVPTLQEQLLSSSPFCSEECFNTFVNMYCQPRLLWHLSFLNRGLSQPRVLKSSAARKAGQFWVLLDFFVFVGTSVLSIV
ncbi:hypothetical protein HPB47_017434 [Ixodes persulcatus]|uniref:Uncharacterized protein n=1 Tax=Ixodes persulcatus TaxID=34615 RepID=A0AC60QNF9_IXOPE|nr:hypothetical protein HPB47_017434 [Ixodes persulcatus]